MPSPLSGALNKARTSFGGPLGGFQGPQTMQMPQRPPGLGGGMPPGMLPQSPIAAPAGMPPMPTSMPPMPGNTGIVPPHMRGGPMGAPAAPMGAMGGPVANRGRQLAMSLRKRRAGGGQKFGNIAPVPMDGMPTMPSTPSGPPGAALV